jgi:hypothetical protein
MRTPPFLTAALLALLPASPLATGPLPAHGAQEAAVPAATRPTTRVAGTVTAKDQRPAAGCAVTLILNTYEPGEERSRITSSAR